MKILVCVKQVPDTTEIRIDPKTNTLIRDGVPAIVNTFDTYALEAAARIKDQDPDTTIVVMTMGPQNAEKALKTCLAVAADKAYLISGRAFGGSDTLATSYILKNAVKKIEALEGGAFDAIFCGKQAIDGDTAQVGPELAEHLGYPQITCALEIEKAEAGKMEVLKEGQDANQLLEIKTPCVITFTKPAFDPRYATIKRKMAANRAEIPVLGDDAFPDIDRSMIGLKGSPTHVKKTYVPEVKTGGILIQEESAADSVAKLLSLLDKANIL